MNGEDLRLLREARGVTASAVAAKVQVNPSTICRIESREAVKPATERAYLEGLDAAAADREAARRWAAKALMDRASAALLELEP
jgi:transcriptional regulator with XRE-family HTH domain